MGSSPSGQRDKEGRKGEGGRVLRVRRLLILCWAGPGAGARKPLPLLKRMPVGSGYFHASRTFKLSDTKSMTPIRGGSALVTRGCSGLSESSDGKVEVDRFISAAPAGKATPTPTPLCLLFEV